MIEKLNRSLGRFQGILHFCLLCMIAFITFSHGTQKLFGWFGGQGIQKTAVLFEDLGLTPGIPMVVLAGVLELAFAVGILIPKTRIIAGIGIIIFFIVIGLTAYKTTWFLFGGYAWEYGLLIILSTFLAITIQTKHT